MLLYKKKNCILCQFAPAEKRGPWQAIIATAFLFRSRFSHRHGPDFLQVAPELNFKHSLFASIVDR